ncbi:MAG: sigma-70 family RNA polymerase sigma factor [Phycisphaerae bacterium]|jgi:RNA polymerase sigma factor (sigma-70 family)
MLSTNCHSKTTSTRSVDKAQKVFEEYGSFIRKAIRFHLGNVPEAEDLYQDMFLFLVSRPLPEDVRNVPGFLYRVITTYIIDRFRHETRIKAHVNEYIQGKEREAVKTAKPSLTEITAEEKCEKMFEIVQKKLSRNEALAITLRYKHDLDISQTADKMGIKPRSVSRCLSTGIGKLRRITKSKGKENI